jgi:hypothetical protein
LKFVRRTLLQPRVSVLTINTKSFPVLSTN